MTNIQNLIESGATVTLSINANDLKEFLEEVREQTKPEQQERYLSPKQVSEIIDVDNSTLWRWRKSNYFLPIKIGGKIRYKLSDIQKLMSDDK